MADHLILSSLQPSPPFLLFSSSLHRRCRRFPGGSRFSFPQLRLSSSQLQLANSTSPSQSSSEEEFDLVSTTQLEDGSHVFRFGDASEIERYLENEAKLKKRNAKLLAEEASKVLRQQEVKDGNTLVDQDRISELESPKEKSNYSNVIKIKDRKRVRSPTKRKKETSASVNVSQSEEKVASVSNLSSIVSVAEAIPSSSTEEKTRKSEPINENESTVESLSSQVIEKVSVNAANLSSIVSVAEAIPTSSIEDKVVVVSRESEPNSENVQVMEKASVNDIRECEIPNGYQKLTENRVEVQARPSSSTSQHGSQSYRLEEVAHLSTVGIDDSFDVRETPMKPVEAEENLVVEPTATATVSPDELISASKATHHSVDKIAETPVVDMSEENLVVEPTATATICPDELISVSEVAHHSVDEVVETPVIDTSEVAKDGETAASAIEDEIAVSDTITNNGSICNTVTDTESEDLQLPTPETTGLESTEVALDIQKELVSKAFYLESGFASLQSPFKALAGRQDAYFVSHHNWLGIADGVSQWSFEGIKKGTYAQELMSNCQQIISDETAKIADPVQLLQRSADETKSPGSSTALIAHLDNNELHVANIGDSGFMVIRNRKVLQKSSPMFHHFCFPLQITQGDDDIKLAEAYHVNLEEDDIIITATDGLFDNLYEKEIVAIVCRLLEQSLEPQKIAELVAAKAQEVGRSKTERTPFADAAKEEGYDGYKGGKLDDVTVIVSIVKTVSI